MRCYDTPEYPIRVDAYNRLRKALNMAVLGVGLFPDVLPSAAYGPRNWPNPIRPEELPPTSVQNREPQVLAQIERVERETAILRQFHNGIGMPSGIADIILQNFSKKNLTDKVVRGILNEMRIPNE